MQADYPKKKNTELPDSGIISKLKGYLGNGFSGKNYLPSLSVSGGKKVNAITYNLKGDFPQISRVSLNAEMQTQEHLENAEYTFGNINFGDTLAEDWLASNHYNRSLNYQ